MPAPSPTGYVSTYLDRLATTVANSATFRTLVGAASVSAAKASIKSVGNDLARPRCLINYGENFRLAHRSGGGDVSGGLLALFEIDVPAAYLDPIDYDAALWDFRNTVGLILGEMHAVTRPTAFVDDCLSIAWLQLGGEELLTEPSTATQYLSGLVEIEVLGAK
jgi:hypothetical protein